jgi:hypothetical protein
VRRLVAGLAVQTKIAGEVMFRIATLKGNDSVEPEPEPEPELELELGLGLELEPGPEPPSA